MIRFLSLVILCLATSAQAREVRHDETIIRWNTERLSIVRDGQDRLVYQDHEEKNERGDVIEGESGTVLSVVGPWVSISESWYSEGGAHPSYGSNWRTFDAVRGGGVSLRDLFAESVLFTALRKHPVLLEGQREATFTSLDAFLGSLDGGCQMTLDPSLLKRWAFHERKANSVVIQIGISHGYEVCRGNLTEILIELPIPPALVGPLDEADQRKTLRKHLEANPNPRPPRSGLEAVHVQGSQLFKTNLKTGETEALDLGKVLAAGQDADGHWWVVSQRSTGIGLARIPVGMDVEQRKPLLGQLEAGIGHYKLVFPDQSTLTLTDFGAQRAAEKSCGGRSGKYLCDETMGWTSRKTWTWKPEKELLQKWDIPIPSQPTKPIIASAPPPKPFRSLPCMCWGQPYGCGDSTPLGSTGMSLIVNDVECGDMTHPSCVVQSADKKSYASFSIEDLAKRGGLEWASAAEVSPKNGPFGSCGPFYFSVDGGWVTDGKGVFCSLEQPAVCTAKLRGEFLGTTGLPLRLIELP